MAMMRSHFSERAKAITLPPAPAKMSMRVVWLGVLGERSCAIRLRWVLVFLWVGGRKGGREGEDIRGDGFGGYAEPGVVGEADVVVVVLEDVVALVPVFLNVVGDFVDVVVVVAVLGERKLRVKHRGRHGDGDEGVLCRLGERLMGCVRGRIICVLASSESCCSTKRERQHERMDEFSQP
jgi:hypothetical protein